MFNQLQLSIFTFTCLIISVTCSTTRDLINFNVYQTGPKIHGHFKLPGNQLKVNFHLDQVNSSHYTFSVISGQPASFDFNGDFSMIETDDGRVQMKGQAMSKAAQMQINFDTKLKTVANGHLIESKVKVVNKNGLIVESSVGLDLLDNCWPLSLRYNITTVPVGLITYRSAVNGYCDGGQREENNVTLFAELGSTQLTGLNSTLDQYWTFNSTGGSERMTFNNQLVGSMEVTNNWVNTPIPIMRKQANFISNLTTLPSFRLSYVVDNGKQSYSYEPID